MRGHGAAPALALALLLPMAGWAQVLTHSAAGLTATLSVTAPDGSAPQPGTMARIGLTFTTEDGRPARGLRPAAWAERAALHSISCRERVRALVQPRTGRSAEIDLNAWHLAVLGDNGVVYALDPVGGNSRSRLLAVANLAGVATALVEDAARDLFLAAVPATGEVVEVDSRRWAERRRIAVGGRPARLAPDPAGMLLWVAQDGGEGALPEVAAVDRGTGAVLARHPAGRGPQAIAAMGAGRAIAAGPDGAWLLGPAGAEALGGLGTGFAAAAWSPLAEVALLLAPAEGRVLAVRPDGRPVGAWDVAPGAMGLFPDPTGRLLLVPEPAERRVTVIDLGRGTVAHRVDVQASPRHVGFSRTQAYVRLDGGRIALLPLAALVGEAPPPLAGIAAGEGGLGDAVAAGDLVATAPGDGAMLLASPEDRVVHVYMEGMAAPSGALRVPQQVRPLAIAALDRGLREVAPGRYETQAVFAAGGRWVVPVMQQGGGFLHCFELDLEGGEAVPASRRLQLSLAAPEERSLRAGAPARVALRLHGPERDGTWRAAPDLVLRSVQFATHWLQVTPLRPLGDGYYEAEVEVPRPGLLNLYVESGSLGLGPGTLPHITLRATDP